MVPVILRTRQIDSLARQIRALPTEAGIDQINELLVAQSVDWLWPKYNEFQEQCWKDNGTWYNHEQSDRYLSEEALAPPQAEHWSVAPTALTGLGILGTFIGIIVGLYALGTAGLSDGDRLAQGIEVLVRGLGFSFASSIAGLVLSIMGTFLDNRTYSSFALSVANLTGAIDARVERAVSPQLLAQLLKEERLRADSLERVVQSVGESLREPLDHMTHSLHESMERAIQSSGLVEAIQDMASTLAQHQQEGAAQLLETFNDKLADNFGDNFGQLGASIDQMVSANTRYEAAMGRTVAQLESGTRGQAAAAAQIHQAAEGVSVSVGQLAEAARAIQDASTAVEGMLASHGRAIEQQAAVNDSVLQSVQAQTAGWEEHQKAVIAAYGGIEQQFEGLRASVVSLTTWHDRVKAVLDDQLQAWRQALDTQHALTRTVGSERENWKKLIAELDAATTRIRGLGGGLQKLSTGLVGLSDALGERMGQVQDSHKKGTEDFAKVAAQLEGLNETMGDTWKDYAQVAGQLSSALPNVTGLLEGLTAAVGSQQELVGQTERLARSFGDLARDQQKVHAELGKMLEASESARMAMLPTATALTASATSLNRVADRFGSTTELIGEVSKSLGSAANQLAKNDASAQEQWKLVHSGMLQATQQLTEGMNRYHQGVNQAVERTFKDFDSGLGGAVSDMNGAIQALHVFVEELEALATQLTDSGDRK